MAADLSALLVQAAALASNAQKTSTPTPTSGKDANSGTPADKDPTQLPANSADLAALIAQAFVLATKTQPATTTTSTTDKTTNSDFGKTSDNPAQPATTGVDLSTLIAQASILASTSLASTADASTKASATVGKDLPILGLAKAVTASVNKEKKSATTNGEGTFLQSGSDAPSTTSSLLGMMGLTGAQGNQSTGEQELATTRDSKKSPLDLLAATASSTAGTANVEKKAVMNTDLNTPQALSGLGANTVATSQNNPSGMQIKLSSNNDFNNALKQVMHVAQLNETSLTRTPMRVAIEIQTPPGAVVNVYVSKQNDQWRAQLSTNDPAAMSWVQDKMTSLRSQTDLGVTVRWLPPQMEATSTSSGHDANLSWDRGGQGQSNYQQPDERQQNQQQQQQTDDLPDFASIKTNLFMNSLSAAGSAS